jgi:hypothetical protein
MPAESFGYEMASSRVTSSDKPASLKIANDFSAMQAMAAERWLRQPSAATKWDYIQLSLAEQ